MSVDDFQWKETHKVLEEFSNLLTYTCIFCANHASPPYNLGRCAHIFCLSCVEKLKGGKCPVTKCGVYARASEIRKHEMVDQLSKHVLAIQQLLPKEPVGAKNAASISSQVSAGVLGPLTDSGGSDNTSATSLTSETILEIVPPAGAAVEPFNHQNTNFTFDMSRSLQSVSCEVDKVTTPTMMEEVTIKNSKTLVATELATLVVKNKGDDVTEAFDVESVVEPTVTADSDAIDSEVRELQQDSHQGIPAHSGGKSSRELTPQTRSILSPEENRQLDRDSRESPRPDLTHNKLNRNGLLADIQAIFMNSAEYSDFSILCGGISFPCHEFILRARSTVLDSMFQNEITETSVRSMNVNDVGPNTIAAVLEFMYTEGITREVDSVKELLYIADKYNMKGLVELCLRKLPEAEDHMVVDFLFMAHKHNFIEFKKEAMLMINRDKLKYINDKKFMDKIMEAPNLLLELYKL